MKVKEYVKRVTVYAMGAVLIVMMALSFAYIWYNVYNMRIQLPFWRRGNILLVLIYGVIFLLFSKIYGALRVGYLKKIDVITSLILTILCTNVITYFQISLIARGLLDAGPMLMMMGAEIVIAVAWSFASAWVYSKLYRPRKMLVVYGDRSPDDFLHKMMKRRDKFTIREKIHVREGREVIYKKMRQYDAVVIWDLPAEIRNDFVKFCFSHSIRCYQTPKISDILIRGAERIHMFDTPLLLSRNTGLTIEQMFFKRLTDIVISLLAIIVTSPVMLVIAICVKCYDRGPVFYKQERLTIGGKPFMIYKFRSMCVDSEKKGAMLAKKNDSRVTPVGRVIRNLHVDELPQLFNILKGDMSVVGPRPERKTILRNYEKSIPEFHYRLKVKAGLTGYAHVYGKYNTTPYDKLKLDLFYIQNYSYWLDIQLMFMTFRILFQKETSEGVDSWQKDALRTKQKDEAASQAAASSIEKDGREEV